MSQSTLLQVLHGETTSSALPAEQRARVEASLTALRAACAVPPLDRQKLLAGMIQIDARSQMTVIRARPQSARPILRYAAVAALILIAASAMLLTFSPTVRNMVWGGKPAPQVNPLTPQPDKDGSWRFAAGATVRADRPDHIVIDDSQALVLKTGEAELNTDGALSEPLTLLKALDNAVSVSVNGSSKCTVRAIPERKILALSIYAGAPKSVQVAKPGKTIGSFSESGGENVDIVVQIASADDAKSTVARWADIREALPPVCPGEVYLKLNGGRLLRGIVTTLTPNGILLTSGAVPESILNTEVAGWAPAETPRGRKAYASWLSAALPEQLNAISRQWVEYLAQREVTPDKAPATFTLPAAAFPDVAYSVREGDGKLYFEARPAAGLGEAWQLDEHGKAAPESAMPPPKQDF